jgi:DNA polymerase-3 subunit gamma/tau
MSYQVIARKYRPQTFADVVGQEHVTQTLAHAIERKRIAHAYLFCGPRGTGKTTIARIFAKCLNAQGGPRVDFAADDPKVKEIAEGRSLDVLEIDAASNRGIDEIRGLRDTVRYAPASSKFKVYIIDEVHMLTKEAFNALLKTLEEPPEHVKFMFATTEPEKILPTILSRCQRFDLRRIPTALIVSHLGEIAKKEQVKADPAALYAIARGAEGCMRDAESTLDQLISFCGNTIEEADVLSMFGLTGQGQLLQLTRATLEGKTHETLRLFNELADSGKDLGRLLSDLLNHFRNLLIFQVSRGDLNMIEVSETEAAMLAQQSKLASIEGLTRILEVLGDAESRLRDAASKAILIEVALLKAIEARSAVSLSAVLNHLHDLRVRTGSPSETKLEVVSNPAPKVASPRVESVSLPLEPPAAPKGAAPQPEAVTPAAPRAVEAVELERLWAQVIEAVGRASPFTRSYLIEAHPVSFSKNLLTIGFDPEFEDHIALVDTGKTHTLLQTKLAELGHPRAQVKFIKAEAPANRPVPTPPQEQSVALAETSKTPTAPIQTDAAKAGTPAPVRPKQTSAPPSKEEFKNDPLIRKALELFRGQIAEVRA